MSEDIDFGIPLQEPEVETLPVVQFETQPVVAMLVAFKQEVSLMVERAKGIPVITNDSTNQQAVEWGAQAKKLHKRLEELRKHWVVPHNEFVKEVNNFFKIYQGPLEEVERHLGRLIGGYRQFLENERRRKEAEMVAESRRLQAQIEDQAKKDAEAGQPYEVAPLAAPVLPEVPHVTRTSEGSASQRKEWTFEIEDESKVPREYLMVDERKLRQAVKGGVREIPGVKIFEQFITGFRV
jgi:hypothetical protein